MDEFLVSCVDRYRELVPGFKARKVATPFLPEPVAPKVAEVPLAWDTTHARDAGQVDEIGELQPIAA
jgi:hypothetical protein